MNLIYMDLSFIKRVVERPISLPYILNLTMPNMCYYGAKQISFDFITYAKKSPQTMNDVR